MARLPELGPRERILDAAEHAFGDFGFEGTSLRDIVHVARVNLATVYYYFRSKEGLMDAVLKRRFGPLREEQLRLLREAEARANGRPLSVAQILSAFLRPPLQAATGASVQGEAVARLIGRIATEPNPQTQEILRSGHADVRQAVLKALQAALPHVPTVALRWRLEFAIGAMAFILCNPHKLEIETHGACNPVDADTVLAEMIALFTDGFGAPAPACTAASNFKSQIANFKSQGPKPKPRVQRPKRRPARTR